LREGESPHDLELDGRQRRLLQGPEGVDAALAQLADEAWVSMLSQVLSSRARTCWLVKVRLRDQMSAATPVAWGDAIEVPARKA